MSRHHQYPSSIQAAKRLHLWALALEVRPLGELGTWAEPGSRAAIDLESMHVPGFALAANPIANHAEDTIRWSFQRVVDALSGYLRSVGQQPLVQITVSECGGPREPERPEMGFDPSFASTALRCSVAGCWLLDDDPMVSTSERIERWRSRAGSGELPTSTDEWRQVSLKLLGGRGRRHNDVCVREGFASISKGNLEVVLKATDHVAYWKGLDDAERAELIADVFDWIQVAIHSLCRYLGKDIDGVMRESKQIVEKLRLPACYDHLR